MQIEKQSSLFAVKTTANKEKKVASTLENVIRKERFDILAIISPDELKGYILIEAANSGVVEDAIQFVPHARSVIKGNLNMAEILHFLTPKPTVTGITVGAIIELISGPFKGEKAQVKRIDEKHEKITVELFDAVVPIPITIHGDSVRILKKEKVA